MVGSVSVNQVFHDRSEDRDMRILYIAPDSSFLYWIELSKHGGMPEKADPREVDVQMLAGNLESASDTWLQPERSNEKGQKRRDELWNLLGDALANEPAIYEKGSRTGLLKAISKKSGIPINNLYPLVKRYWLYGKVKDAFLPGNERKGGRGKPRRLSRNTGPVPTEKATSSKVITDDDRENFETYIKKYYLTQDGYTLEDTYDRMIREKYAERYDNGSGIEQVVTYGMGKAPTYRQFSYWYSQVRDKNQETARKKGQSALNLKERAVTGKADYGMKGPGAQFQIDATITDVYLVSRFNRENIIGRPVVYFVKDTFSRCVTGLYIGLEGPNWTGMAMALYNAFSDKVDFCHRHGIEISADEWPCRHLPFSLIGDRGELEGTDGERLASRLGIQVDNTPPYRGDLKPIIERHFRILNEETVNRLPGSVKPDLSERGGHDYRLDAILDLEQFARIVISDTLTYNKVTLQSLEPSEEMMKAGIELTPLSIWNWGIQNYSGLLRTASEETCRLALMPEDQGSITKAGIKFHKLFYSCDEAVKEQWFENARRDGKSYTCRVSYDPRDVHAIYVWHDGGSKPVRATLLDWEQKYDGKSSDECAYEIEVIDLIKAKRAKKDRDAWATAKSFSDSVVNEARTLKESASNVSKSQRISGIKDNRTEEKEARGADESFVKDKEESDGGETGKNAEPTPDVRGKRKMSDLEKWMWGVNDDE